MSGSNKDSDWLDNAGQQPHVHGYAEASELLNDARLEPDYFNLFTAAGASQGRAGAAGERGLLNLNGEEHRRLRSEVAQEFRPRRVDRVRDFARDAALALLAELPRDEPVEFMKRFAKPYVKQTTGHYIGFPLDDLEALIESHALMTAAVVNLSERAADFDRGANQILDYAIQALEERQDNPTDDVLGRLAQLVKSGAIDELFAAQLVSTLISAGMDPTILQLGLIIEELSKLPEVWDGMARDPAGIPRVLEELLRMRSANLGVVRRLVGDVTQHGVTFTQNTRIHIDIADANHDARRFPCPDAFDVEANTGTNLAFGFGPHHCLGAPLVRAQLQQVLAALTPQIHCPVVREVEAKKQGLAGPVKLVVEITQRG